MATMDKKYYYLVSSLPELHFGQFSQLQNIEYYFTYIHEELDEEDSQKVKYLFYPYDNRNLVNICLNKKTPWNPLANFTKEKLMQYLNESSTEIPSYLNEFYDNYLKGIIPDQEFVLQHEMAAQFYNYALPRTEGFVHNWLVFNRDFRNILVAMSARQNKWSTENQFIGDNSVVTRLKTETSANFGMQADFPFIDYLLKLSEDHDIVEMEKQIDFLRWTKIDELCQFSGFGLDSVAAFMAKLIVVHRWTSLDIEKGKSVIQTKLDSVSKKIIFSKEFTA